MNLLFVSPPPLPKSPSKKGRKNGSPSPGPTDSNRKPHPSGPPPSVNAFFKVVTCQNASSALTIARALQPELVLVSDALPELEIATLCAKLPEISAAAQPTLLLLSRNWVPEELPLRGIPPGVLSPIPEDASAEAWEVIAARIAVSRQESASFCLVSDPAEDAGTVSRQRDLLEKTVELQEEKIRQLEFHLRHTQRLSSLGMIASGIAHDFNNILCGIICLSEIGEQSPDATPKCKRNFRDIQTTSTRAAELVQAILSYSKRQERPKGPIYPAKALGEVLLMLRATIPAFVEVEELIEHEDARILGELSHFQQILTNLILNARHAIGNKRGKILVQTSLRRPSPEHLEREPGLFDTPCFSLKVCDDGSGISEENLKRIFDPFFTTKPAEQGTGLGLWVTKGIVESWHGHLMVDTEIGKGTCFTIYIPSYLDQSAEPPFPPVTAAPTSTLAGSIAL